MSGKVDTATGAVSIAIFGIQATLTPADASAWANVITTGAPALLIIFLIWRIYRLDKQHEECSKQWSQTRDQLHLAYEALVDESKRCQLPTTRDFLNGNFTIERERT